MEELNLKYVISFKDTFGLGTSSFFICNDELISLELRDKLGSGSVEESVYFSGYASKICDLDIFVVNASANHIILTKLEKK